MKSKTYKNRKKPVSLLYDHMIWHTKYNRKVLKNSIRSRCEQIIREVLNDLSCECVTINVQPNHVHLLVGIPPEISPSYVTMKVKGVSSRILRRDFPTLKEQSRKALWTPSCVHQSVGGDPVKTILGQGLEIAGLRELHRQVFIGLFGLVHLAISPEDVAKANLGKRSSLAGREVTSDTLEDSLRLFAIAHGVLGDTAKSRNLTDSLSGYMKKQLMTVMKERGVRRGGPRWAPRGDRGRGSPKRP